MDIKQPHAKFGTAHKSNRDRQFSLASLLLVIFVVAVTFALPRLAIFPALLVVVICQIAMRLPIARLAMLAGLTLVIRIFIIGE